MRISEKKINRMTRNILDAIMKDENVRKLGDSATIEAEIKAVIVADLKMEDAIEEEARQRLDDKLNNSILNRNSMDYQHLLRKTIQLIAREKKFTI